MSSLAERLRKARERKGLSQLEVYNRTNINNKTLSRYEKGGTIPDIETLKTLANLYEVSLSYLSGDTTWDKEGIEDDDAQFILRAKNELTEEAFDELMDYTKRMKELLELKHGNKKN